MEDLAKIKEEKVAINEQYRALQEKLDHFVNPEVVQRYRLNILKVENFFFKI